MADNPENILVEFDYNNITIIDPNKVIDSDNKVKDRYVKQEDLVMYANLECNVLPRTKLALGVANNDSIRTVSIAKINFFKGKIVISKFLKLKNNINLLVQMVHVVYQYNSMKYKQSNTKK